MQIAVSYMYNYFFVAQHIARPSMHLQTSLQPRNPARAKIDTNFPLFQVSITITVKCMLRNAKHQLNRKSWSLISVPERSKKFPKIRFAKTSLLLARKGMSWLDTANASYKFLSLGRKKETRKFHSLQEQQYSFASGMAVAHLHASWSGASSQNRPNTTDDHPSSGPCVRRDSHWETHQQIGPAPKHIHRYTQHTKLKLVRYTALHCTTRRHQVFYINKISHSPSPFFRQTWGPEYR